MNRQALMENQVKPRCVIVSLSTVQKFRRLDAGYYTGQLVDETIEEEARAAKIVRQQKRRIKRLRSERVVERERIRGMIERREIVPFPNT